MYQIRVVGPGGPSLKRSTMRYGREHGKKGRLECTTVENHGHKKQPSVQQQCTQNEGRVNLKTVMRRPDALPYLKKFQRFTI